MNRKQRRRFAQQMRFSKITSEPAAGEANKLGNGNRGTCDWPGCQETWEFVTMARVVGRGPGRRPIARRCKEHRIQQ
jgi:hypothetical protein